MGQAPRPAPRPRGCLQHRADVHRRREGRCRGPAQVQRQAERHRSAGANSQLSIVDLVVKVSKKCSKEDGNAAVKAAADGPMKGIINFEEQPLVSSDFKQTDYSNSVDSALTMVMGEDLVKVVMWYDNEWGYSQRVLDLTAIVAETMPVTA